MYTHYTDAPMISQVSQVFSIQSNVRYVHVHLSRSVLFCLGLSDLLYMYMYTKSINCVT